MREHIGALLPVLVALLVGACGSSVRPLQDSPRAPAQVQALVVTLEGHIGTPELALCHRVLREADSAGLAFVVFRLDSAGSIADDPRDVAALLDRMVVQGRAVQTVAFVRGKAISAGAQVALLCDQIFMQPGASIGLIAPTEVPLEELLGLSGDDAERRRLEQYRSELRYRLEQRRTKLSAEALRLCEGMVDPTLQLMRVVVSEGGVEQTRVLDDAEVKALAARGVRVIDQSPLPRPVDLDDREAFAARLSSGTLQSFEQLLTDHLLIDRALVGEAIPNWAERMVGWLELMQPAFLVLGFVLLILEIKTPGVGLPGALGVLLLGLAMFYSYLTGLAEVTEILLFFLGIAAIAVEIFVMPGSIVFGAVGFVALLASLVLSRQSFLIPETITQQDILLRNLLNLMLLFVLVLVVAAFVWRVVPKIPILRSVLLRPPDASATGASTEFGGVGAGDRGQRLIGRLGTASTVLRPAGVMEIDGEPIDVVTQGEFVEAGRQVKVIAVEGNRVVVEVTSDPRAGERGSVGLVLLLVVVGLALLVAEVIFVSFGVITVLSGLALISAVFLAFQESNGFGYAVLISEALLAPVVLFLGFKLLPRTSVGKAIMLDAPQRDEVQGQAEERGLQGFVHKTGVTLSALRPAGFARIDGRKVDVVTRGEMLEQDCPIRVVEVQGNRVVVTRHAARDGTASEEPRSAQ